MRPSDTRQTGAKAQMEIQILSANVALAGDARNVVARGTDNPITFPEAVILQTVHGKSAVTDMVELRREDREPAKEHERLTRKYGRVVTEVFPLMGTMVSLQGVNPDLPTLEEVQAGETARKSASAKARSKAKPKAKPKAAAKTDPEPAVGPETDTGLPPLGAE
jgi:hypothetical protein